MSSAASAATGKGLEGVVAARTTLSDVQGDVGKLIYVGYDIDELEKDVVEICLGARRPFLEKGADDPVDDLRRDEGEEDVDKRGDVLPRRYAKDFALQRLDVIEAEREVGICLGADEDVGGDVGGGRVRGALGGLGEAGPDTPEQQHDKRVNANFVQGFQSQFHIGRGR